MRFYSFLISQFFLYKELNSPIILENGNIFIYYCLFITSSNTNGGSILCDNVNLNLNLTHCVFYKCFSFSNGGAIYLKLLKGNTNLSYVCSIENNVQTGFVYPFGFISTPIDYYIILYGNSISKCPNTFGNGNFPFQVIYSQLTIFSMNYSNNNGNRNICPKISYPKLFLCSFNSFSNNSASNMIGLEINGNSNTPNLYFTFINLINNNINGWGLVYLGTINLLIFQNCNIYNNIGILIKNDYTGYCYIQNCWFNHLYSLSYGNVIFQSNYPISNTFKISYYLTHKCFAEITLTFNLIPFSNFYKFFFNLKLILIKNLFNLIFI